ncbi:protein of unknown function [Bradyrhizobium vignae]|uniref:Uncharacterized protein n=1 Tax=Bradyrhizobium vignae TaxID=1549949 RepID=A0A2U3PUJ0_9BRAD|nr:protein of unknown function [Bradyrhizobium vignae]
MDERLPKERPGRASDVRQAPPRLDLTAVPPGRGDPLDQIRAFPMGFPRFGGAAGALRMAPHLQGPTGSSQERLVYGRNGAYKAAQS